MDKQQTYRVVAAYCVHKQDHQLFQRLVQTLDSSGRDALRRDLQWINDSFLNRILSRTRSFENGAEQDDAKEIIILEKQENKLYLDGQQIGRVIDLYKASLPYEAQSRIAYNVFFDRAFHYLAREHKIVVLHQSEQSATLFIPGEQLFDWDILWSGIVDDVFGRDNLRRTFIALMNSIKLADRGFSALDVPIAHPIQAQTLAAFNVKNLLSLQKGDRKREREIRELDVEIEKETDIKKQERLRKRQKKTQDELSTRIERYSSLYDEWKAIQTEQKDWSKDVLRIANREYAPPAGTQIAKAGAKIGKAVKQIRELATLSDSAYFELPPLLREMPPAYVPRRAGDDGGRFCYSCGRVFEKKERTFTANTLIFASASQRLQSGGSQTQPKVCATCAAVAFVSPIKLGEGRLVLRLRRTDDEQRYLVDEQLRMFALGEMNIVSGRYALLKASETIGKKMMLDQLGGLQYALYKVASILSHEVFEKYQPQVTLGEVEVELKRRHVAWMSRLIDTFNLRRSWNDKAQFAALGRAIRYLQKDQIPFAVYELLKAGLVSTAPFGIVRAKELDMLKQEQVRWLEMDNQHDKAQFYRDVAGMTGLLYAFCNFVESEAPNDKKRIEVRKLIERTGDPFQFIYTAAGNTKMEMATLYRNPDMHFCYEELKCLLENIGIDSKQEERESKSDKGISTLILYFDDIVKAHTLFLEGKYARSKDKRDFLYALKLSLHARFPQYISTHKEQE